MVGMMVRIFIFLKRERRIIGRVPRVGPRNNRKEVISRGI
jgi:hypothetical protein